MTNEEIKEHLEKVKKISEDNDTRKDGSFPCGISVYDWKSEEIDNLPKDFDWQEFWKDCKEYYPLHSVSGKTTTIYNIITWEENKVPMNWIKNNIRKKKNPSVIEIGYGFGGAAKTFEKNGFKYKGIDYVSSDKENADSDKFIEITTSGIPEKLLVENSVDLVYSTNVFQHLTKEQRIQYYEEAYKVLKKGGLFYFDLFSRNEDEFQKRYTEEEIKNLSYATNFFGVHTSVPYEKDVLETLEKIGYKIVYSYSTYCLSDMRTIYLTVGAKK